MENMLPRQRNRYTVKKGQGDVQASEKSESVEV